MNSVNLTLLIECFSVSVSVVSVVSVSVSVVPGFVFLRHTC